MNMKTFIKLLPVVVIIVFLASQGCKDSVSADTVAPTLTLYSPLSNDTVLYGKTPISYDVSDEQGVKNVNVFVNDEWVATYQPKDGAKPEVYLVVDSAKHVGKLISYYITATDKSNNASVSDKRTGIYVTPTMEGPQAPSGVALTELTKTTFRVEWAEFYPFTDVLELWRKAGSSGTYIKVKNVVPDSLYAIDTVSSNTPIPRYFYKLKAVNHYGSSFSSEVSITKAPTAPNNVGLLILSPTIFNISWKLPYSNAKATGLELWRKEWEDGTYQLIKEMPVTHNNVNDTIPDKSIKYYYQIRATNNFGSSSSAEVATPVVLPPPYSITVTLLPNGNVQVSWSYGNAAINYFRISRGVSETSMDSVANLLPNVRTWIDTTVNWNISKTYYYKVTAVKGADEAESDVKSVTNNNGSTGAITPPSNIQASPAGSRQINLTWNNPVTSGVNVRIERKKQSDISYTDLGVNLPVTSANGSYSDNSVVAPNTYQYRIRYTNGSQFSSYSQSVSATVTPVQLTAPGQVVATALGRHKTRLVWNASSGDVVSYRIQRGQSEFQLKTVGTTTATAFTDSSADLMPNVSYIYRVQAVSLTDSAASANYSVIMLDFDTPSNITITKSGVNGYALIWKINWQYQIPTLLTSIERKWVGGGESKFTEIARTGFNVTQYIDSNVVIPSSYVYRLRAIDGERVSDYSAEFTINTSSVAQSNEVLNSDFTALQFRNTDAAEFLPSRFLVYQISSGKE